MSFATGIEFAFTAALTGLLVWAAVSDIINRKIPNICVLAVLGLFVAYTLAGHWSGLLGALGAGAIAFVICYAMYAFNIFGAGDAKLFAAVALFAGLAGLPTLALLTVFAGGLMAVVTLASRPKRALAIWAMKGQGDWGRGIPYGVAIAIGSIVVQWDRLLHFLQPLARSLHG